jgi:hypothetical protein
MDLICDNQFLDIPQEANQHREINQQEMILELLEVLLEKGDIRVDELQRAKHILYSEYAR